jgi:hypothetical protein
VSDEHEEPRRVYQRLMPGEDVAEPRDITDERYLPGR